MSSARATGLPGDGTAASPPAAATTGRRPWLAAAGALALTVAAVAVLAGGGAASRGSTVSRGPGGWLAARRYLEASGAQVTLIAEPLMGWVGRELGEPSAAGLAEDPLWQPAPGARAARPGVLVMVFPWQGQATGSFDAAIDAHLASGGDLVLAYSGEEAGMEQQLAVWRGQTVGEVPVAPWRWREYMRREWELQPATGPAASRGVGAVAGGRRPLRVWAPRVLPELGAGARVLYTAPGGKPAVAVLRYHGGRVVMLPADALSNARLAEAGNADLLETLLRNLGRRWAFDEYHHGLVTTGVASGGGLGRAADLLLAHLVVLYVLAALALARRQGPAWREPARAAGSSSAFLLAIGALHHRLGHHHQAALLLLQRTRELDRSLDLPPALDRMAANAGPDDLLAVAREVTRRRTGRLHPAPAEAGGEQLARRRA